MADSRAEYMASVRLVELDVLARLAHGGRGAPPRCVDEAGAERQAHRIPAGAGEEREVAGREVRDERQARLPSSRSLPRVGRPSPRARRRRGGCAPRRPTRTPTTPWPPTVAHSRPRRLAAAWTATLWALEAAAISPCPQVHTPTGTETTETPATRSTGSQPTECKRRASSTERSDVMPRAFDGGAGTAKDWAPRSISARTSGAGGGGRGRLGERASCCRRGRRSGAHPSRTVGRGNGTGS